MQLWLGSTQGNFTKTFDTLAALPKPRRAVWSFLGLTALTGLVFVLAIAVASDFAGKFGVYLSNVLSLSTSGILAKPTLWGMGAAILVGCFWLVVMAQVRRFSGWLGGETAGDV